MKLHVVFKIITKDWVAENEELIKGAEKGMKERQHIIWQ